MTLNRCFFCWHTDRQTHTHTCIDESEYLTLVHPVIKLYSSMAWKQEVKQTPDYLVLACKLPGSSMHMMVSPTATSQMFLYTWCPHTQRAFWYCVTALAICTCEILHVWNAQTYSLTTLIATVTWMLGVAASNQVNGNLHSVCTRPLQSLLRHQHITAFWLYMYMPIKL